MSRASSKMCRFLSFSALVRTKCDIPPRKKRHKIVTHALDPPSPHKRIAPKRHTELATHTFSPYCDSLERTRRVLGGGKKGGGRAFSFVLQWSPGVQSSCTCVANAGTCRLPVSCRKVYKKRSMNAGKCSQKPSLISVESSLLVLEENNYTHLARDCLPLFCRCAVRRYATLVL